MSNNAGQLARQSKLKVKLGNSPERQRGDESKANLPIRYKHNQQKYAKDFSQHQHLRETLQKFNLHNKNARVDQSLQITSGYENNDSQGSLVIPKITSPNNAALN